MNKLSTAHSYSGPPVYAIVLATLLTAADPYSIAQQMQPRSLNLISKSEMLRSIDEVLNQDADADKGNVVFNPISAYHDLKRESGVSHTLLAKWLGTTRRTLYNWLAAPEKSTKNGPVIEDRVNNLSALMADIEPEHYGYLKTVAFSPIWGDVHFGESILNGASKEELISLYDSNYEKFEALRNMKDKIS